MKKLGKGELPEIGSVYELKFETETPILYKTKYNDKKHPDASVCLKVNPGECITIVDIEIIKVTETTDDFTFIRVLKNASLWYIELYIDEIEDYFNDYFEKIG